jgi:tRNA nucleotidyltransferase/poly(A) polymerase
VDDLRRGVLRAVGDPLRRFDEDALRLVRAARLAAQLGFEIEERTLDAMCVTADLVRYVSRERMGGELRKLLRSREPSRGLRIMADTGILSAAFPELAEQRGVAQNKVPGMDCWEHTLTTVDAARRLSHGDEILPLAALFHDAGKPRTLSDGHFFGHELVGAQIAEEVLRGMAVPREEIDAVAHLVRHHMFNYELTWSDAAVRRLVQRVGPDAVDDLLALREADNLGSGQGADQGHLLDLRRRITEQRERGFATSIADLAVNGNDLQRELGLQPGPVVGELLSRLLESAIADPARNTYRQSILDARGWLPELLEQAAKRKASPAGGADGT